MNGAVNIRSLASQHIRFYRRLRRNIPGQSGGDAGIIRRLAFKMRYQRERFPSTQNRTYRRLRGITRKEFRRGWVGKFGRHADRFDSREFGRYIGKQDVFERLGCLLLYINEFRFERWCGRVWRYGRRVQLHFLGSKWLLESPVGLVLGCLVGRRDSVGWGSAGIYVGWLGFIGIDLGCVI